MTEATCVYPRIDAAVTVVESEIEATRVEVDAFRDFRARLKRIKPESTIGSQSGGALATAASVSGTSPGSIRDAYRETVMAMPHYERDYGESLIENVTAEFGVAVRELLRGETPISWMHFGVIETATGQSLEEREEFLRALEGERDSLRRVSERLETIEQELLDLQRAGPGGGRNEESPVDTSRAAKLNQLAGECQKLSTNRQQKLHHRVVSGVSGIGDESLVQFLYDDTEHRFPALVEIADVLSRIESLRPG